MRIIKSVLTVILTLSFFSSFACLNEMGVNVHGQKSHDFRSIKHYYFKSRFDTTDISNTLKIARNKLETTYSYETHSNIAVYLLKLGKFGQGLDILIELNKKHPDNYSICANLGTAYELNGNLDSAIHYIKKGIQLNPKSHNGSEWIHVKILETKIALAKEPNWLEQHTVLNLPTDSISKITKHRKNEIIMHLMYQLQERIPFTPLPDEIVAHLLTELGDIYTDISIEDAYLAYSLANIFSDHPSIDTRIKNIDAFLKTYKIKPDLKKFLRPFIEKKMALSNEKIKETDSIKNTKTENPSPEKITLVKPVKAEVEKKENDFAYLFWGLLPVIIALLYIVYRNKKYRKQ